MQRHGPRSALWRSHAFVRPAEAHLQERGENERPGGGTGRARRRACSRICLAHGVGSGARVALPPPIAARG